MAESETGMSDLMDDLDLEKTYDTGYKEDVEVDIIDSLYHQNVAFMDEKIQIFADFWMKRYLNCCLQCDNAVESSNDKKSDEAKAFLEDWPTTIGEPNYYLKILESQIY